LVLQWYRVAFDLRTIVLGVAGVAAIMLVCYASIEIAARALIKRDDLSEAEFSQQLYRATFPRVMAVAWFVAFLLADGVFMLFDRTVTLLEKRFPFLVAAPEIRLGFPLLFAATIFWLCGTSCRF
jgi:hypothetical protein